MLNREFVKELRRWRENYSNLRVWVDTPEGWTVITAADMEDCDGLLIINGNGAGPAYSCENIDRIVEFLSKHDETLEVVLQYGNECIPVTIFVTADGDLLISSCEID